MQDKVLTSSRKPKVKKKGSDVTLSSTGPDAKELQGFLVFASSLCLSYMSYCCNYACCLV